MRNYSAERMNSQNNFDKERLQQCMVELELGNCVHTRNFGRCKTNSQTWETSSETTTPKWTLLTCALAPSQPPQTHSKSPPATSPAFLKSLMEISYERSKEDEENQKSARPNDALTESNNYVRE